MQNEHYKRYIRCGRGKTIHFCIFHSFSKELPSRSHMSRLVLRDFAQLYTSDDSTGI